MKLKGKNKADTTVTVYFAKEPEELVVPDEAEDMIRKAVMQTLVYEKFLSATEVSVTFCNGDYIRGLNALYRQKDCETDVLSFPIFEQDEEDPLAEETVPLGDIVLNLDRAARQAEELGHSVLREVAFLTIHSTLHLLGYDHERSAEDDEDMCRRQREIIALLEKDSKCMERTL